MIKSRCVGIGVRKREGREIKIERKGGEGWRRLGPASAFSSCCTASTVLPVHPGGIYLLAGGQLHEAADKSRIPDPVQFYIYRRRCVVRARARGEHGHAFSPSLLRPFASAPRFCLVPSLSRLSFLAIFSPPVSLPLSIFLSHPPSLSLSRLLSVEVAQREAKGARATERQRRESPSGGSEGGSVAVAVRLCEVGGGISLFLSLPLFLSFLLYVCVCVCAHVERPRVKGERGHSGTCVRVRSAALVARPDVDLSRSTRGSATRRDAPRDAHDTSILSQYR